MPKSYSMRLLRLGLVLVGLGLGAACATAPGEEGQYKKSVESPALRVPGDLALPPSDPAMVIPAPAKPPAPAN